MAEEIPRMVMLQVHCVFADGRVWDIEVPNPDDAEVSILPAEITGPAHMVLSELAPGGSVWPIRPGYTGRIEFRTRLGAGDPVATVRGRN